MTRTVAVAAEHAKQAAAVDLRLAAMCAEVRRLRRELGESWRQLAASLAPLTALTIGLVALTTCLVLRAPNWNDTLIRATFVGLSAVALPHLVLHGAGPVIDQMSRNRPARTVELRGAV